MMIPYMMSSSHHKKDSHTGQKIEGGDNEIENPGVSPPLDDEASYIRLTPIIDMSQSDLNPL